MLTYKSASVATLCIVWSLYTTVAPAFGDRWVEQPAGLDGGSPGELNCVIRAANFNVHLSYYQYGRDVSSRDRCHELPETGNTLIVADLISADRRIRRVPIGFRVVEENATHAEADHPDATAILRVIRKIPARPYKTGVAEINADFDRPGHYALLIDVEGTGPGTAVRIPLGVATQANSLDFAWYTLLLSAAFALFTACYVVLRRRRQKASSATAWQSTLDT